MLVRNHHACVGLNLSCASRAHSIACVKHDEERIVHSDSMKIQTSIDMTKGMFLMPTNAQLQIELCQMPMTMTYQHSLARFETWW